MRATSGEFPPWMLPRFRVRLLLFLVSKGHLYFEWSVADYEFNGYFDRNFTPPKPVCELPEILHEILKSTQKSWNPEISGRCQPLGQSRGWTRYLSGLGSIGDDLFQPTRSGHVCATLKLQMSRRYRPIGIGQVLRYMNINYSQLEQTFRTQ